MRGCSDSRLFTRRINLHGGIFGGWKFVSVCIYVHKQMETVAIPSQCELFFPYSAGFESQLLFWTPYIASAIGNGRFNHHSRNVLPNVTHTNTRSRRYLVRRQIVASPERRTKRKRSDPVRIDERTSLNPSLHTNHKFQIHPTAYLTFHRTAFSTLFFILNSFTQASEFPFGTTKILTTSSTTSTFPSLSTLSKLAFLPTLTNPPFTVSM